MKKISLLVVVLSLFTAYQVNTIEKSVTGYIDLNYIEALASNEGGGSEPCKWSQDTCDDGGTREVCLTDGNGSHCTCGSVTRPC